MTDEPAPEKSIADIADPLKRIQQIDIEMEYLQQQRSLAVLELYARIGATAAANELGMSRANVYRIVAELLEARPDIDFDSIIAQRHADQRWDTLRERVRAQRPLSKRERERLHDGSQKPR